VAGGDVEEGQLVGAGSVVKGRLLHRITRVAQSDKIDAFYDSTVFDIQAGYDSQF
jgi:hypothetical protein